MPSHTAKVTGDSNKPSGGGGGTNVGAKTNDASAANRLVKGARTNVTRDSNPTGKTNSERVSSSGSSKRTQ